MERESFENEEIAEILNQYFVSIKVDREERPDVDKIYMVRNFELIFFRSDANPPLFRPTYNRPPGAEDGQWVCGSHPSSSRSWVEHITLPIRSGVVLVRTATRVENSLTRRAGFAEILTKIAGLWKTKRAQLIASGDQIVDAIKYEVNVPHIKILIS